jgi:alkylation response protein AidB-like acyl-CoA dehydrogenase
MSSASALPRRSTSSSAGQSDVEFRPDAGESGWLEVAARLERECDWPAMESMRAEMRAADVERDVPSYYQRLASEGLVGIAWPRPWGRGATPTEAFCFHEQFECSGLPGYSVTQNEGIGSMILRCGSDELIAEHLPHLVAGTRRYVGGLSEPDAGSDLLALRTTAVRDGDDYVVNGTKLWTSGAHLADYLSAVVRTDPAQTRQRGLSVVLIPTTSLGVEIRPVRVMGGWRVNEVHLANVRVPVSNRVGPENDGWRVLTGRLDEERAMSFGGTEARLLLTRLIHALSSEADKLPEDVLVSLGRLLCEAEADRLLYLRLATMAARGESTSGAAPMNKLSGSELAQRVAQWAADVVGADALYPSDGDANGPALAGDIEEFLRTSTVLTIMGGTSQVQRNTAAARALGLPREK